MTVSKAQRRMVIHGLIITILGLIGGFSLGWKVIGGISFPPIPGKLDVDIPGTIRSWRAVHTGNILNGLMAIILAGLFFFCELSKSLANKLSWGTLFVIWGNCIFYVASVFAPNRGLSYGSNAAGEGNLAGFIAFIPAFIAAYALIIILFILLKNLKKSEEG